MKHLHFTQSLEPLRGAGLGYSALELNQGLNQIGCPSELLATRAPDFERRWPNTHQYVRRGPAKAFFAPSLSSEAAERVREAEVVHGHGFYVYSNWLIGKETRKQAKPLIYHTHGFFDPWILKRSRAKKQVARWLFENANFKYASFWRALSEKEELQIRSFGIKAPVVVLPNGVHLPPERNESDCKRMLERWPKTRSKRLLFLSRIHRKKGLDLLFPAWAGLPKALTADWEISIFGPDEGGYQATLESLVRDLGLEASVSFYGSVSGEAKEAALRSADLFVLPSYSEGFPMAVLEAASYGIPVVQTDECNFPALTEAGGAWEATPTIDSVREKIHQALAADQTELKERGQAGLKLVSSNYSWGSIAKQLDDTCRKIA